MISLSGGEKRSGRMFEGKSVLITGGEGMIGMELRDLLHEYRNCDITIADIKNGDDLRDFKRCIELCRNKDYVFHLAGVKGSPKMTEQQPVNFMTPMLQFDTNMIEAASLCKVDRFLYTSSIAVLNPESDRFPAWAKKTAEVLIEAYRKQYPYGTEFCIVRPANVYGRYDNFDNPNAMVITSLIKKAMVGHIDVWGDGSQIRDFINAKDVARGMIIAMEEMCREPINLCSGEEHTIREVVDIIVDTLPTFSVQYDVHAKRGDEKRVMESNGHLIGFKPKIKLEKGIKEVIEWLKPQS